MIKYIFFLFSIICSAQKVDLNVIISIDGCLYPSATSNFRIQYITKQNDTLIRRVDYYPGKLIFDDKLYLELKNTDIKNVNLMFDLSEFEDDKHILRNYNIELKFDYLCQKYFILYVHNTDKKCNNGVYIPLPGKKYTYEYELPNIQYIEKRLKKKRFFCDCN